MAATAQSVSRADPQFGPPSEPINIQQFISDAYDALSPEFQDEYETLSEEAKMALSQECSLADLCDSVNEISNNPKLLIAVHKENDYTLQNVVDDDVVIPNAKKRKRDTSKATEAVDHIREVMQSEIALECWPIKPDANMFIRSPKYTELNSLSQIKFSSFLPDSPAVVSPETRHAILTISFYNRPWRGRGPVSEFSQHVFYSAQTLGDLYDAMLCPSKGLPEEQYDSEGRINGYARRDGPNRGGVIVMDGTVYTTSDSDYADKLLEHNDLTKKPAQLLKATKAMHDTPLSSLTLRTQFPYWMLHEGNCEHFFIVESIRLQHARDFPRGYPLTTKIIPVQLDNCRACKTPAAVSIVNDMRLGESPCLLCLPCWRKMGEPDEDEGVVIVPLPEYKTGW